MKVCIKPCILPVAPLPSFMDYPKSIKQVPLLRPKVSSRVSVTYGVAKVLIKVLKPLVGKSPHHIQSTKDFVSNVRKVTLLPGECLCSYDVSALFPSVPIDPALNNIKDLLEKDDTLHDRTVLSVQHIFQLFGFCLHNTYFLFQDKFYEQVGAAGGVTGKPYSGKPVHGVF